MPYDEDEATGIPTRAIHEAYLDMQRSLSQYRNATDSANNTAKNSAHGQVQNSVLTLFEFLRPHLLQNSAVSDFWHGKPPSYPSPDAPYQQPDPNDGVAVLAWQRHRDTRRLNGTDPSEIASLRKWADELEISDSARLVAVQPNGSNVLIAYDVYQMGMKHLDDWQTTFVQTETDAGGLMTGKKQKSISRDRVPIEKLRRAGRELANAADKLGALSTFDASTPRTQITPELIEEVEEWRQKTLD